MAIKSGKNSSRNTRKEHLVMVKEKGWNKWIRKISARGEEKEGW